jgi:hypothetical protein
VEKEQQKRDRRCGQLRFGKSKGRRREREIKKEREREREPSSCRNEIVGRSVAP